MEGRDIGTVILPDAHLKIYLEADSQIRANRRKEDGENDQITNRDEKDSSRKIAPLIPANGCIRIDTWFARNRRSHRKPFGSHRKPAMTPFYRSAISFLCLLPPFSRLCRRGVGKHTQRWPFLVGFQPLEFSGSSRAWLSYAAQLALFCPGQSFQGPAGHAHQGLEFDTGQSLSARFGNLEDCSQGIEGWPPVTRVSRGYQK